MIHQRWKINCLTVMLVAGMASLSLAQDFSAHGSKSGRGVGGFVSALERQVGLTPEQRDAVRGLLAAQREKSKALREETDGKIRAMLNADQQKKFDQVVIEQKARFSRGKQSAS